jgi:hypothetical protein
MSVIRRDYTSSLIPRWPLCASPRFDKSTSRRWGVQSTTPTRAFARSCDSISLCDLSRSAAQALTSQTYRFGSLLASLRRTSLRRLAKYCELTREGTRQLRRSPAGCELREQPFDSYRTAKLQHRKSEAFGVVFYTPRFRARDLAKRDEAQGGQRGG